MWICKFRGYDKDNEIRKIVEETKVEVFYYPVNYFVKNKRYNFIAVGIVKGENKNKFFNGLRKLKKNQKGRRVEFLEIEEDFFVLITSHSINHEEKKFVKTFYNPEIIHFKPIFWNKNGWEEWEIACVRRKPIEEIIRIAKKVYELELLKFHQRKIKNYGLITMLPELTAKQEKALKLALKHGYYHYPRKISLDKLSKIAKLSFSTFQAHVKKAENKIISYVTGMKK